MKRFKKGFTLIETIIALGILALIAAFLLPSLQSLIKSSNELKNEPQIIFALEEAMENERNNPSPIYDSNTQFVNGFEIIVTRSNYNQDLDKIKVELKNYELELLEVNNEKKGIYSN